MESIAALLKTVSGWPARYYLALGVACAAVLWLSASPLAGTLGLSDLSVPTRIGLTNRRLGMRRALGCQDKLFTSALDEPAPSPTSGTPSHA